MGYNTVFNGEFKFSKELTAHQLAKINLFLGEDCRDHPEWDSGNVTYIDLILLPDFSGIKWDDGCEKTYDMCKMINFIINEMQKTMPEFGLTGEFLCQGEEFDDRYKIVIENGFAVEVAEPLNGEKIMCPHCEEYFLHEK